MYKRQDLTKATPKHEMPDVTWYPETEFCYMKNKHGMFVACLLYTSGTINEVEMTTQGCGGPINPLLRMDAARACLLSGHTTVVVRRRCV